MSKREREKQNKRNSTPKYGLSPKIVYLFGTIKVNIRNTTIKDKKTKQLKRSKNFTMAP